MHIQALWDLITLKSCTQQPPSQWPMKRITLYFTSFRSSLSHLTVFRWWRNASYSHREPPLADIDAAEEPQDDQKDTDKDQNRPCHLQLYGLEALLLSHANKDKGGPNGHESQTDIQKYLKVALFFPIFNFYFLTKICLSPETLEQEVILIPEQGVDLLDVSKPQEGQTKVVPKKFNILYRNWPKPWQLKQKEWKPK